MTLKPTDMLEIQSAIDEYERKFPRRPAPSAEVALAWRLGKRVATTNLATPALEDAPPWVEGIARVGWWGMFALITASVFFFGAVIGGLRLK